MTINESITKLFFAGILPGLVLAAMFMGYVAIYSKLGKDWNPNDEGKLGFAEKVRNSRFLLPVILLITVVIGSMYLGYATATEAAAFGVIGSLLLAAGQGSLNWKTFTESLMGCYANQRDDRPDPCWRCIPVAVHGVHRSAAWAGRSDRRMGN